MASDDERRELAERLRETCDEIEHDGNGLTVYELADVLNIREDCSGMVESLNLDDVRNLADLIDRPTCHDVADFGRESFKCSRCGYRVLSIDGAPDAAKLVGNKGGVIDFGYCPNCCARVTKEEDE